MASIPREQLASRAKAIDAGAIVECESLPGAGSLPGVTIPSIGIAVPGDLTASLRSAEPAIIARVREGETVCDLRTVDPRDDAHLATALRG
jgi:L-seryl-tRNA(Ser) seleniumtransferase